MVPNVIIFLIAPINAILLLVLFIIGFIYRFVVIVIARIRKPDLRALNCTTSTILSDDDYMKNSSNCSVVTVLKLSGSMCLSEITRIFEDNVICARINQSSDILRYPELRQYLVNFMGYPFWKNDYAFCTGNHIRMKSLQNNFTNVSSIHETIMNSRFTENQSPWQLTYFESNNGNQKFLALKIHHSIADGRSILKLVGECLGKKKRLTARSPKFGRKSLLKRFKIGLIFPLRIINLHAQLIKWKLLACGQNWSGQVCSKVSSYLFIGITKQIELKKVKNIARANAVRPTSVIISTIMNSLRKFSKVYPRLKENLPFYLILPKYGHPSTFTNHLSMCITDSTHLSFRQWNKLYDYFRTSDHSRTLECITWMIASLPKALRVSLAGAGVVTTGISNMAGEEEGLEIGDCACQEMTMSTGFLQGSIGVGFTVLSFTGGLQIGVVAKNNFMTKTEAAELTKFVEREFLDLITQHN